MANTFSYSEFAKELREKDFHLVDRARAVIRKEVKLNGPRLVQAEIEEVQPRRPIDRGTYRRSFRFEDIKDGATMYNFQKYAPIIEGGRRPGSKMPPLRQIEDWVRRKRIGVQSGPLRPGEKRRRPTPAMIRSIAYVIARAIKARGLPAYHIVGNASATLDRLVRNALTRELGGVA